MSDSSTVPAASRGVFARAIGIIVSPEATYREVVQLPRPAPILLLVCVVMALATGLPQMTERGRQASMDMQVQQTERFTGQPITPAQQEAMNRRAPYTPYISMVTIFIFVPIACLFFTALYWAAFNTILGGTATFKQVLGIITHAQVIGGLGILAGAPVQYVQGTQTAFGPFTLGALFPMLEPGSVLANLLGTLSVFQIWSIVVTAIGLSVLYHRKARNVALALLGVYVLVMAAITSVPTLFRR